MLRHFTLFTTFHTPFHSCKMLLNNKIRLKSEMCELFSLKEALRKILVLNIPVLRDRNKQIHFTLFTLSLQSVAALPVAKVKRGVKWGEIS